MFHVPILYEIQHFHLGKKLYNGGIDNFTRDMVLVVKCRTLFNINGLYRYLITSNRYIYFFSKLLLIPNFGGPIFNHSTNENALNTKQILITVKGKIYQIW